MVSNTLVSHYRVPLKQWLLSDVQRRGQDFVSVVVFRLFLVSEEDYEQRQSGEPTCDFRTQTRNAISLIVKFSEKQKALHKLLKYPQMIRCETKRHRSLHSNECGR
jgi:hypothetical protein